MIKRERRRILVFHRLDLTMLFAGLAAPLSRDLDVLHLAYGPEEKARLDTLGISGSIPVFKDEIRDLYCQVNPSLDLIEEIDALIIKQTDGAFNLNSAIQSDRGFSLLDYDEALKLTATYYVFWTRFIEAEDIDFVLHEPCTLMFNFLPALIIAERGGHYLYNIMAIGQKGTLNHLTMTGFDFTCPQLDLNLDDNAAGRRTPDLASASAFLTEFRESFEVFLGGQLGGRRPAWREFAKGLAYGLTLPLQRRGLHRIFDNIDYWQAASNRTAQRARNLRAYESVHFDDIVPGERYYFYPMHLEPEAVVLYHAHGIYENQVKLIQNIAGQLPPGSLLYVKDHPHDHGYRAAIDYHKLTAVPNIRLLSALIPGKEAIRHAQGVITLTGTAGFEALLLGKEVYTFGKSFYSRGPRVDYLHNVRDLREALYTRWGEAPITDTELLPFVAAYLETLEPGLTDYFAGRAHKYGIDLDRNATEVAASLLATIAKY